MRAATSSVVRRGSILPIVAVSLVVLFGFVALAVDVGVMAMARTQAQNAADTAAVAGARTLNGTRPAGVAERAPITTADNNYANAGPEAQTAAGTNTILGQAVAAGMVQVQIGKYLYDSSLTKFIPFLPSPPPSDPSFTATDNPSYNWSLARAQVTFTGNNSFAPILPGGLTTFTTVASATAVHRPRDVSLVVDFTGSMGNGSPFFRYGGYGPSGGSSNNPESVYPLFGHYSDTVNADLRHTSPPIVYSGSYAYTINNETAADPSNSNQPPIIDGSVVPPFANPTFVKNAAGAGVLAAWPQSSLPPDSYATTPGGDVPLHVKNDSSGTYAARLAASPTNDAATIFNGAVGLKKNSLFEPAGRLTGGYQSTAVNRAGVAFKGYTQGPRYWGKTFFIWPPDPRIAGNTWDGGPWDWRKEFFLRSDGSSFGSTDAINGALWDSTGLWQQPQVGPTINYLVNYKNILSWIKSGPNPFPSTLRAGRILYYSSIPSTISSPPTGLDQTFWKDYIDYIVSFDPYSFSGGPYSWNNPSINMSYTERTDPLDTPLHLNGRYMDYTDNPQRPRLQFWFGPMSLLHFLNDSGKLPGNCTQAPIYVCKLGLQGALQEFKNNHPNDLISLIVFSTPKTSAGDSSGRFNQVRAPMGRLYQRMQDSLWFPPYTIDNPGLDMAYNDAIHDSETPRAGGTTAFAQGLMMAYNQFSGNATALNFDPSPAPVGNAGGLGRRGARKLLVFETDGIPNTTATASLVNAGPYNSYYQILYNSSAPSSSQFPSVSHPGELAASATTQIVALCQQLCALDTASPPGYSTTRNPVLIHTIGFGPAFGPSNPSLPGITTLLQSMQTIGSVSTPIDIVNDTPTNNVTLLQQALTRIMQDGVQISLIR